MAKIGDYPVFQGGLMRCCLATLGDRAEEDVQPGTKIPCAYEADQSDRMVLDHEKGELAWRWVGP